MVGLGPDKAKMLMDYIADELEEVEFEGQKRWVRREDIDLIPSWDCYVMFYHPREFFVSQNYRARVFRKLEGNAPVLLIDGVAGGVWEQQRKSGLTEVRVRPFSNLSSAQKTACQIRGYRLRGISGDKC